MSESAASRAGGVGVTHGDSLNDALNEDCSRIKEVVDELDDAENGIGEARPDTLFLTSPCISKLDGDIGGDTISIAVSSEHSSSVVSSSLL